MVGRLPIGAAPTLLIVLLALSSGWLVVHPGGKTEEDPNTQTVEVWVFARTHYDAYEAIIPDFERTHPGVEIDLQLVSGRALNRRLQAAFWADLDTPDLAELEISSVGSFFRGPLDEIGFVDLTDIVHSSGLYDRCVQTRFAPWSTRGHIFGIPHDVHPVMLTYRKDIFEEEGIDAADLDTWDKFVEAGRRITRDLDGDGTVDRYMIELSDSDSSSLEVLLFQRDGGYFDAHGNLIMDNDTAVETLRWYVPLVAGPDRIANSLGGGQILTQAVEAGYLVCLITPDWRSRFYENDMPRLAGNMALMPLPAAQPGGRRTSTWGGTMVGITKDAEDFDLAWEVALHLYYAKGPFADRFHNTNIIPPTRDAWDLPALDEPREYWSGQRLGRLFIDLADDTPPQYTSPYTPMAKAKLGEAVTQCVLRYRRHGEDGFDKFVRRTLKGKAAEVRALMARNPFLSVASCQWYEEGRAVVRDE